MFIRTRRVFDWIRSFWFAPLRPSLDHVQINLQNQKSELKNLFFHLAYLKQIISRENISLKLDEEDYFQLKQLTEDFLEKNLLVCSGYISNPIEFFDTSATHLHFLNRGIENICHISFKKMDANPLIMPKTTSTNAEFILACEKALNHVEILFDAIGQIQGEIKWYCHLMVLLSVNDYEQAIDAEIASVLDNSQYTKIHSKAQEYALKASETGIPFKELLVNEFRMAFQVEAEKKTHTVLAQKIYEHGISLEIRIPKLVTQLKALVMSVETQFKLEIATTENLPTGLECKNENSATTSLPTTARLSQLFNITPKSLPSAPGEKPKLLASLSPHFSAAEDSLSVKKSSFVI